MNRIFAFPREFLRASLRGARYAARICVHGYLHKRVQRGSGRPEEYRERSRKREHGRVSFVEWWTRLHSAHSKAGRITRRQRFSPFFVPLSFSLLFQIALTPLFFLLLPSDPFQPFFQEVALSLVGFCPTAVAWQHAMQGFARDQPATGDFRLISLVRSTRTHRIPFAD